MLLKNSTQMFWKKIIGFGIQVAYRLGKIFFVELWVKSVVNNKVLFVYIHESSLQVEELFDAVPVGAMGNESSCEITLENKLDIRSVVTGWTLYNAVSDDQSTQLSVFSYPRTADSEQYINNAAKYLKTLRHPNIIKFHAVNFCDSHKNNATVQLITERVNALELVLDNLSAPEILSGLHDVAEALAFLHDRADSCHNSVSTESVFVSVNDGSWRLGGFECAARHDLCNKSFLSKSRNLRPQNSIPPEEKGDQLSMELSQSRDVYSFGVLAEYLLEYVADPDEMLKSFKSYIHDRCLNMNPAQRPRFSDVLRHGIFKNDLIEICSFLRQITMKSDEEKQNFFKSIIQRLSSQSEEVIGQRLVKPLMSRFVVLDPSACRYLLPYLLTPRTADEESGESGGLLSEETFKRYVIQELYKIFHVRDAHVRSVLLSHFSKYVHLFDYTTLQHVIFPQILISLRDASEDLVALSLRALSDLVPLLGADVVIGSNRNKIFSQGTPRFVNQNGIRDHKPINNMASNHRLNIDKESREAARLKKREEFKKRALERKMSKDSKKDEFERTRVSAVESYDIDRTHHDVRSADTLEQEQKEEQSDVELEQDLEALNQGELVIEDNDWEDFNTTNHYEDKSSREFNSYYNHNDESYSNAGHESYSNAGPGSQEKLKSPTSSIRDNKRNNALNLLNKSHNINGSNSKSFGTISGRANHNVDDDWGNADTWEDFEAEDSVTSKSSNSSSNAAALKLSRSRENSSTNRSQNNQSLGAEFDIMSLDIKTTKRKPSEQEFDFFADMAPTINTSKTSVLDVMAETRGNTGFFHEVDSSVGNFETQSPRSSLFQVKNSDMDSGAQGWEDESSLVLDD